MSGTDVDAVVFLECSDVEDQVLGQEPVVDHLSQLQREIKEASRLSVGKRGHVVG